MHEPNTVSRKNNPGMNLFRSIVSKFELPGDSEDRNTDYRILVALDTAVFGGEIDRIGILSSRCIIQTEND
jgi:hypothetical protein